MGKIVYGMVGAILLCILCACGGSPATQQATSTLAPTQQTTVHPIATPATVGERISNVVDHLYLSGVVKTAYNHTTRIVEITDDFGDATTYIEHKDTEMGFNIIVMDCQRIHYALWQQVPQYLAGVHVAIIMQVNNISQQVAHCNLSSDIAKRIDWKLTDVQLWQKYDSKAIDAILLPTH